MNPYIIQPYEVTCLRHIHDIAGFISGHFFLYYWLGFATRKAPITTSSGPSFSTHNPVYPISMAFYGSCVTIFLGSHSGFSLAQEYDLNSKRSLACTMRAGDEQIEKNLSCACILGIVLNEPYILGFCSYKR